MVDGETYEWSEYLLHNATAGYLWISEYQGHFSVIRSTTELPKVEAGSLLGGSKPVAKYLGRRFEHFQRAQAKVTWLAGEFNWRVKLGDACEVNDYVSPPLILSSETTDNEITWSVGEYTEPALLWKAFSLPGRPWTRIGVAPNQPAPLAGRVHLYWLVFFAFLLAGTLAQFGFMALNAAGRSPTVPFLVDVNGTSRTTSEPFEVGGTFAGPVTVRTSSNANDSWLALGMQFTNVASGRSWRLDRQLGYRGVGASREGGNDDVAEIASLPRGATRSRSTRARGPSPGRPATRSTRR